MSLFNILPGSQKTPAGLERRILRRLPRITWVGTAVFAALALAARALPWSGSEADIWTRIHTIDIYLIGLAILHWTVVLTVGIGAFIVMVMKGPAYVADAYPLVESDHPAPPQETQDKARRP
jgi:hypothetical protein